MPRSVVCYKLIWALVSKSRPSGGFFVLDGWRTSLNCNASLKPWRYLFLGHSRSAHVVHVQYVHVTGCASVLQWYPSFSAHSSALPSSSSIYPSIRSLFPRPPPLQETISWLWFKISTLYLWGSSISRPWHHPLAKQGKSGAITNSKDHMCFLAGWTMFQPIISNGIDIHSLCKNLECKWETQLVFDKILNVNPYLVVGCFSLHLDPFILTTHFIPDWAQRTCHWILTLSSQSLPLPPLFSIVHFDLNGHQFFGNALKSFSLVLIH